MTRLLTINAGSSSLRFTLFDLKLKEVFRGHFDAIGKKHASFRHQIPGAKEERQTSKVKTHQEAIEQGLDSLIERGFIQDFKDIQAVAHRVVHGGERFQRPTPLNRRVLKEIEKLIPLAPLHNPANLAAIRACQAKLKKAKHVAIFDTAFHSSLPEKAYLYGLPYKLYVKDKIRRYGFHGTSHAYIASELRRQLKKKKFTAVSCHIGNGVSIAAIKNGQCLDTSMGFTPLEGPMMGTRSGSIDPAIPFYLMNKGMKPKAVKELLEHESGFKGLSGLDSDIRTLYAKEKSSETQRVFKTFSYQMAKLIASTVVPLGGTPDALCFTAGIGENAFYLRQMICEELSGLGLKLDARKNKANALEISSPKSSSRIFVIPTNEALQMARALLQEM